ncbi:replication factor C subunit 1-like [Penaeus monodon]|uniref:replication factor C subunit 1-like n=1 Tax=Penaeus monodon TaxID=6687 RepID=UPI0018A720D0|nr:replication factor C subunit 1-like [Penaeus monodon]
MSTVQGTPSFTGDKPRTPLVSTLCQIRESTTLRTLACDGLWTCSLSGDMQRKAVSISLYLCASLLVTLTESIGAYGVTPPPETKSTPDNPQAVSNESQAFLTQGPVPGHPPNCSNIIDEKCSVILAITCKFYLVLYGFVKLKYTPKIRHIPKTLLPSHIYSSSPTKNSAIFKLFNCLKNFIVEGFLQMSTLSGNQILETICPSWGKEARKGPSTQGKEGKRKAVVIDSDEEDPLPSPNKKRVLASDSDDDIFCVTKNKKQIKKEEPAALPKPTHPKIKTCGSFRFFGTSPLIRKRGEETSRDSSIDDNSDDDFEKTLEQLDRQQQHASKRPKQETKSPSGKETKPKPNENSPPNKDSPKGGLASKLSAKLKESTDIKAIKDEKTTPQKDKEKLHSHEKKKKYKAEKHEDVQSPNEKDKNIIAEKKERISPKKEKITPKKEKGNPSDKEALSVVKKKTPKKSETSESEEVGSTPQPEEKKKNSKAAYLKFLQRSGPSNPGSKEIPEGEPDCLQGLVFVLSGVYESLDREEASELIKRHGGKVTTSVSRNTSYLVLGNEAGESKIKKAEQLGTKHLDEDGLLDLIRTRPGKGSMEKTPKEETPCKLKAFAKESKGSALEKSWPPQELVIRLLCSEYACQRICLSLCDGFGMYGHAMAWGTIAGHIPIITMCNDRNHPKIRSLANHCFDLRFYKPRIEQIRGPMMSICFREGIQIKPDALDQIIIGSNQDIRQILHHLSMWSANEKNLQVGDMKREAEKAKKDMKMGPWDVCKKVFSEADHKTMSLYDKSDLFFHDYSIAPLFVQENYPKAVPHIARCVDIPVLENMCLDLTKIKMVKGNCLMSWLGPMIILIEGPQVFFGTLTEAYRPSLGPPKPVI